MKPIEMAMSLWQWGQLKWQRARGNEANWNNNEPVAMKPIEMAIGDCATQKKNHGAAIKNRAGQKKNHGAAIEDRAGLLRNCGTAIWSLRRLNEKIAALQSRLCRPHETLWHGNQGISPTSWKIVARQLRYLLENVWKAREKRRGETRARAVSHGEMRHKLFLIKRQDRDLLRIVQRRHLKVSKSKATWPNHMDKRYNRYKKICSSGQKICEEQGWEQPSKYKVKVHR